VEIYLNYKILEQVNKTKYLGIIFDGKLLFREHINYMEGKSLTLIFALSRSAKVTCGLGHEALKVIYTGGILPLMLYGAPVWKNVLNRSCCKAKINTNHGHINFRIARAYRTLSNEALCVINGITPIQIKIDEIGRVYEITQGIETQYDRDMELENWTLPATHIKTIEGEGERLHPIQAYTDGSKSDLGVGAGVVIFLDNNIRKTMQYRLNERCSNNQAEQMTILKALEYIQNMESDEQRILVRTDSKITLQLLQKKTYKTHRANLN